MPVSRLYSATVREEWTYPSKERFHEYVEEAMTRRAQYRASCGLPLSVYCIGQGNPRQFVALYLPPLLRIIMEHEKVFLNQRGV